MSRIICVADSFDAMTSKRTYRDAMLLEEALEEVKRGLGTQFDEKVGRTFLDSDIYGLWDMLQRGSLKNDYIQNTLLTDDSIAVGALLK